MSLTRLSSTTAAGPIRPADVYSETSPPTRPLTTGPPGPRRSSALRAQAGPIDTRTGQAGGMRKRASRGPPADRGQGLTPRRLGGVDSAKPGRHRDGPTLIERGVTRMVRVLGWRGDPPLRRIYWQSSRPVLAFFGAIPRPVESRVDGAPGLRHSPSTRGLRERRSKSHAETIATFLTSILSLSARRFRSAAWNPRSTGKDKLWAASRSCTFVLDHATSPATASPLFSWGPSCPARGPQKVQSQSLVSCF